MANLINFTALLSESEVAELNPNWKQAMVEDYANIARSLNEILNNVAVKGMMFAFTGAGAVNPTILTNYNVKSLIRQSVGVYRAVYEDGIISGTNIDTDSVKLTGYYFANTSDHAVEIRQSVAGSFDVSVWQINSGVKVAYDLVAGDEVSVSIELNIQSIFAP